MCFSAEASFSIGSILTITGLLCLRKTKERSLKLIAFIPLLFGIQQLTEGVVWLQMKGIVTNNTAGHTAQIFFLLFAWVLWPIYPALAFFVSDKTFWYRALCSFCFVIGLGIAYVDIRFLLNQASYATVVGNSIYYPASPMYGNLIYGFATLVPIFFSKIKNMRIFGLCLLVSFIAAQVIWAYTFASVWCFLVAITSFVLLKILPDTLTENFLHKAPLTGMMNLPLGEKVRKSDKS